MLLARGGGNTQWLHITRTQVHPAIGWKAASPLRAKQGWTSCTKVLQGLAKTSQHWASLAHRLD